MKVRTRLVLVACALTVTASLSLAGCQSSPGGAAGSAGSAGSADATTATDAGGDSETDFAALERTHDARLGVTAIDVGSGRTVSYRSGERFPFASTNKTFIAAATLQRATSAELATVIHFTRADLLDYAPITSRFVDTGMTVRELIDAMLRFSDNTAANLLVGRLGGPQAVEQWMRGIGDSITNVDRVEPDLNEALPGDPRDTTTPAQFAANLRKTLFGDALPTTARTFLRNTMLDNTTGDGTIRAGVDSAWPVADKTGTGSFGVRNDIGAVYPASHAPIVVVVMSAKSASSATPDDALLAAAAKVAADQLTR
ncbi:MAG: class A beta-lactamase [Leifsonia sp.]